YAALARISTQHSSLNTQHFVNVSPLAVSKQLPARCGRETDYRRGSFMKAQTLIATAVGALALSAACVWAPAPVARAADAKVDFAKDVQPILASHCVKCHGADPDGKKPKGKYDMTTKEGAL